MKERSTMIWRKKKELTLLEQTTEAVDRLGLEVADLQQERRTALATLGAVSEWLLEVNNDLVEKHKLASSMIGQLKRSQALMDEQITANKETHASIEAMLGIRHGG
jgi:hypothetical protein